MTSQTFWKDQQDNLLLVNIQPCMDGKGLVLHLRETEGNHATLDIQQLIDVADALSADEVNILEEPLQELKRNISIDHFETKFIKLTLRE